MLFSGRTVFRPDPCFRFSGNRNRPGCALCIAGRSAGQKILDVTITWKIEAAGKIDADIAVTKDDEFPDLPRFGVRMFLDKKLSAARYFGMGPQPSS